MIRPIEKGDLVVIREINAQSLGYDCSLEQTERQFLDARVHWGISYWSI